MLGNSWVTKRLMVSQEGLTSMKSLPYFRTLVLPLTSFHPLPPSFTVYSDNLNHPAVRGDALRFKCLTFTDSAQPCSPWHAAYWTSPAGHLPPVHRNQTVQIRFLTALLRAASPANKSTFTLFLILHFRAKMNSAKQKEDVEKTVLKKTKLAVWRKRSTTQTENKR
jgi:hypothetical protein